MTSNLVTVCKKCLSCWLMWYRFISYHSILRFSILDSPTCTWADFHVRRWRGWWCCGSQAPLYDKIGSAVKGDTPKLREPTGRDAGSIYNMMIDHKHDSLNPSQEVILCTNLMRPEAQYCHNTKIETLWNFKFQHTCGFTDMYARIAVCMLYFCFMSLSQMQPLHSQNSSGTWTKWLLVCSAKSRAVPPWSILTTLILDVLVSLRPAYLRAKVPWAPWEKPGLHRGTPRLTETLLRQSRLKQRLNTVRFCVFSFVGTKYSQQYERKGRMSVAEGNKNTALNFDKLILNYF